MLVPISADLHPQAMAYQSFAFCFSALVPEITIAISIFFTILTIIYSINMLFCHINQLWPLNFGVNQL
ncbi:hypothetical protein HanRHA438_Chr12g0555661 [Helianthus annuus]|nr:hypothetical protein HanIR_Chr12g0586821 [Helianthus annuus]KAJ0866781.1 hypothetical protein HanRHA438_Chr12g0555661 [Helianthus annuus]